MAEAGDVVGQELFLGAEKAKRLETRTMADPKEIGDRKEGVALNDVRNKLEKEVR